MSELGEAALRYAEAGIAVLPLRERDKEARERGRYCTCTADDDVPLIGSADAGWVEATWRNRPAANVGAVCGGRSRLLVLDVDVARGGFGDLAAWRREVEAAGHVLPAGSCTYTTATGGRHHWFRLPAGLHVRRNDYWLRGVEVKACGGYVAAPPSVRRVTRDATYQDADGSLVEDVVVEERRYAWDEGATGPPDAPAWLLEDVARRVDGLGRSRSGGVKRTRDGLVKRIALPDDEEFAERGLGWFYLSRNEDAYHLAFRCYARGRTPAEVERLLRRCWQVTRQDDSSWRELWAAAESARTRIERGRRRERDVVAAFLARRGAARP